MSPWCRYVVQAHLEWIQYFPRPLEIESGRLQIGGCPPRSNTGIPTMELIKLSIAGSYLLIAGHWYALVRARFFASK